uniref:Uncharacterized protein n=1 Tax=Anguilla anguilla TaxID=7936 RepID=A0A0E9T0W8_ANGAN
MLIGLELEILQEKTCPEWQLPALILGKLKKISGQMYSLPY